MKDNLKHYNFNSDEYRKKVAERRTVKQVGSFFSMFQSNPISDLGFTIADEVLKEGVDAARYNLGRYLHEYSFKIYKHIIFRK